ncbi:probable ATP synthase 24 kDa subunit, mitochondrial [Quercus suber]|uniref:probable ATP synthase 24 kDa subunit, mitochondrial n=1 Tax=Quercus suber TaxID=58331 RepID=UPI0032DF65B3
MIFDALEKVEKELKKPLMGNDKKGMAVLMAEFNKINKKLGIRKEDLPKYEEQLELKIAKAQPEELKKDTLEAMETQKKWEEFKDEEMVNPKSLDIRNFI